MPRTIRALAATMALAMVAATGTETAGAERSTPPPGPPPSLPTADEVTAAFVSAGVGITPMDAPAPGPGVTLTDWQAGNVARQAAAGAGLTGTQLRAAFPVDAGVVPIDAIVAAWLIEHDSASADAARSIMPIDVASISDPAPVRYPWAVLVLFVHDLTAPGEAPAGWRLAATPDPAAPAAPGGVCGALSDFYAAMKAAVIDALEEIPIVGTLAELAVALFEQVLGTALQPLLLPIKLAITALGVAAIVAHVVDPWVFFIGKEPPLVIDYGVAPNPGNPGTFEARIEGGALLEWPAALQACAELAGVTLPDLDPNGASVTWTTAFGPHAFVTSQDDTISDDGGQFTATLAYETAVEAADVAAGEPVSADITVSVAVHRPEDQQLGAIVEEILGDALSGLPGPVAQILATLAGSAIGSVVQFNDPSGNSSIIVRFHAPPPPESTVPETSPPPTTTPTSSCIGRLFNGTGALQGTTLILRADGTWALDFSGFPPQEFEGVVVVLAGQWVGTWTLNEGGTGFVIVHSPDSPFTATGTYEGVSIELTMDMLLQVLTVFGSPTTASAPGVATCTNGTITSPTGEVIFS